MNKYLIIVLLAVFGVMPAGGALAFYGDEEMSSGNVLGATTLDFTLRDAGGVVTTTLFNEVGVVPNEVPYIEPLKVKKESGLDFDYKAWFEKTGGDDVLCGELQLKVRHEGVLVYSGLLSAFTYDAGVISGGLDDWIFEIVFNNEDAAFANLSCQFDFVFLGEQIGGVGFYDEERVSNVISTGEWGVQRGDVVINEVMWMGSDLEGKGSDDEWIELRNMTDREINIGKWTIDNGKSGGNSLEMVPNSHIISPHGFLLIARNPKTSANTLLNADVDVVNGAISLKNSGNGNLILRDPLGNIVDYALAERDGDKWAVGLNGETKRSMERNDDPGDGLLEGSWHQCDDADGCRTGDSWDIADGNNYGTPGTENKSDNDPTSVTNSEEAGEGGGEEAVGVEAEEPVDDGGDASEAEGTETEDSVEAVGVEDEEEEVFVDEPVDIKNEEDEPAVTNEEEAVEEESVESDSGEEQSSGSEEESSGSNEPESSAEGELAL